MFKTAAAALIGATIFTVPMASFAGGLSKPVEDRTVIVVPREQGKLMPGSQPGSLAGSLPNGASAGLLALLFLGAIATGGGS